MQRKIFHWTLLKALAVQHGFRCPWCIAKTQSALSMTYDALISSHWSRLKVLPERYRKCQSQWLSITQRSERWRDRDVTPWSMRGQSNTPTFHPAINSKQHQLFVCAVLWAKDVHISQAFRIYWPEAIRRTRECSYLFVTIRIGSYKPYRWLESELNFPRKRLIIISITLMTVTNDT